MGSLRGLGVLVGVMLDAARIAYPFVDYPIEELQSCLQQVRHVLGVVDMVACKQPQLNRRRARGAAIRRVRAKSDWKERLLKFVDRGLCALRERPDLPRLFEIINGVVDANVIPRTCQQHRRRSVRTRMENVREVPSSNPRIGVVAVVLLNHVWNWKMQESE